MKNIIMFVLVLFPSALFAQCNSKTQSLGDYAACMKHNQSSGDHSWVTTALYAGKAPSLNNSPAMPTPITEASIVSLSCENLAKATLQKVDPKLDVEFPARRDWELDYCRDRELWYRQYRRWEAHKGTSTEHEERVLTEDAWSLLQGAALEGPALARRYVDRNK